MPAKIHKKRPRFRLANSANLKIQLAGIRLAERSDGSGEFIGGEEYDRKENAQLHQVKRL